MKQYLEDHGRGDFAGALDLWKGAGVPSSGGVISDSDFTLWLDWLEAEGEVDTGSDRAPRDLHERVQPLRRGEVR